MLLNHTIREAVQDGMDEYRFLRGGESYKARYTDVDRTLQTVAHGRTPLGRLAVASAAGLAGRPRARALIGKLTR